MMYLRPILVLAFCSISFFSQGERNPELDKLLKEVKEARLNSVKTELPEGIHWVEGYYSSGLFYFCSSPQGLHIRDEKNELPTKIGDTINHIEFTAQFNSGAISLIEVHSVGKEHPSHCTFSGNAK